MHTLGNLYSIFVHDREYCGRGVLVRKTGPHEPWEELLKISGKINTPDSLEGISATSALRHMCYTILIDGELQHFSSKYYHLVPVGKT